MAENVQQPAGHASPPQEQLERPGYKYVPKLADYNYWTKLRARRRGEHDPASQNRVDMIRHHAEPRFAQPYTAPHKAPLARPPPFAGYPGMDPPENDTDADGTLQMLRKQFIKQPFPGGWKGVKVFDSGNIALVGLWESTCPTAPQGGFPRRIVIKELIPGDVRWDLSGEAEVMGDLNKAPSVHIVKMLSKAPTDEPGPDVPALRRIIMEYCAQGSLGDLVVRRTIEAKPFDERSLWRMFDCLVDACRMLAFGTEVGFERRDEDEWEDIYHSDFKSDNVFLGPRDSAHQWTPVCKLGDFGSSVSQYYLLPFTPSQKRKMRDRGTEDWYPPESFTERWDYADWATSTVAGNFSQKTNIWAMGAVMWQLIMLDEPPLPSTWFTPDWNINGQPAKGITYGEVMQSNDLYSETLRNLIFECLYEEPDHRPELQTLKETIAAGLRDAENAPNVAENEPWEDFAMPEPPQVQPDPAAVQGGGALNQPIQDQPAAPNLPAAPAQPAAPNPPDPRARARPVQQPAPRALRRSSRVMAAAAQAAQNLMIQTIAGLQAELANVRALLGRGGAAGRGARGGGVTRGRGGGRSVVGRGRGRGRGGGGGRGRGRGAARTRGDGAGR